MGQDTDARILVEKIAKPPSQFGPCQIGQEIRNSREKNGVTPEAGVRALAVRLWSWITNRQTRSESYPYAVRWPNYVKHLCVSFRRFSSFFQLYLRIIGFLISLYSLPDRQ